MEVTFTKKTKYLNRIILLLCTLTLLFSTTTVAFAAEHSNQDISVQKVTRDAEAWTNSINSGGSASCYPVLNSYIGVQKTINISILKLGSGTVTGVATCIMYGTNGEILGAWNITPGSSINVSFNLPKSGTYTLEFLNDTNVMIQGKGFWY